MAGSPLIRVVGLFLGLFAAFSPAEGFAKNRPSATDPWISLEKSLIKLHRDYAPDSPLLKPASFYEQVETYLTAGLWSSADTLLSNAPAPQPPEVQRLRLSLFLKRGEHGRIYEAYQRDPSLFQGESELILGASQGALALKAYDEALALLNPLHFLEENRPEQYYFSALAYWGLKENEKLEAVLADAVRWAEQAKDSPWAGRIHLLKVYHHLNQKAYDLAFAGMGDLFNNNTDLALLAVTWGYFKLGAAGNLFSILQALDAGQAQSAYHSQIYRILSRFLIEEGNLPGAIEMDQRERNELRKQMDLLERETEMLRRGISPASRSIPPGSLLVNTLKKLENQVGEKRDLNALYWYIDLQQRRQMLTRLKDREREIDQEQRRLQLALVRRCLSLRRDEWQKTRGEEPTPGVGGMQSAEKSGISTEEIQRLYQHARKAAEAGNASQAAADLQKVLALAPDQPYGDESAFRLGDMAFERADYAEAIGYYQRLLGRQDSPLHSLSRYKLAWALYLQGKARDAVSVLIQQETEGKEETEPEKEGPCTMIRTPQERREPYRLLALSLAQIGGPEQLTRLLHETEPEKRFSFYEQVIDHYQHENKPDALFQLIRAWIGAYPIDLKTPLLHEKMVSLIQPSERFSIADGVTARVEFVNKYRPGSLWATQHTASEENGVKPILKKHLRFLMTHSYAEAKKTETENAYKSVLTWSLYYLSMFAEEQDIGKDRFFYAETLAKLNENEKAITAFRESAYDDPLHPLAAEAGYQEILLLEKVHAAEGPKAEAAYDRFAARFPHDNRAKEAALRLAELAFQRGDYGKSRFYAKKVSEGKDLKTTTQEMDLAASRLVVQAFLKEQAYAEAIDVIQALLTENAPPQIEKTFKPLLVLSYFQQGESLKHRGAAQDAAEAFWQVYRFGAESALGPLALFEAAVLWDSPLTRLQSEKALLLFSVLYPKSALHHPALMRLASLYEAADNPLKGAETYEKAGRLPVGKALAQKALTQALVLYEAASSWEKLYQLAMEQAGGIHSPRLPKKNKEERARWLLKAAEANFKMQKSVSALKILETLIKESKGDRPVSSYIAQAHFMVAESKREDFEEIELVAPLEENLEKKKALFEALLENYDHAVLHPSPLVALNAHFRIGALFEDFSRALLDSERPDNLSMEEEEVYERLLLEQALPYIKKAEEAYQQNIEMGKASGIENEWIIQSQVHLFMIQQQMDIFNRGQGGLG